MESDKRKVFEAYNVIAEWFAEARPQRLMEQPYLEGLMAVTGKGASVPDLGCGTGLPMMGYLLAQGMQVMGVDGSHKNKKTVSKIEMPTESIASSVGILWISTLKKLLPGQAEQLTYPTITAVPAMLPVGY